VSALIDSLNHGASLTRATAAAALGSIGPDAREAVPALEHALTDDDPVVKICVASALRDICPGTKDSLSSLTEMLGRKNRPPRKDAAWAISDALSQEIDPIPIGPMF
jgi:HEAT repeat protein